MSRMIFFVTVMFLICYSCVFAEISGDILREARALQSEKKLEEARKLLVSGLKDGVSVAYYIEIGSLLGKMQKYDEGDKILEKGSLAYPENIPLMNLSGLIKLRNGDKAGARRIFEKVLTKDDLNRFAKKWLDTASEDDTISDESSSNSNDSTDDSSGYKPSSDGAYEVSNSLTQEEQEKLALELYTEMLALGKWDINSFIYLHKRVIEQCPLTSQAEESCWRLSNLYMLGQDPPEFDNAIFVLEHLLKQYPDTELMPVAKNRLIHLYRNTDRMEDLVALYEDLFTRDPAPEDKKVFMIRALEFANALSAVGHTSDATAWYQKVIELDDGGDNIEARVAANKLSAQ